MTQKNIWIALITLIVAIFVFAQVYILFAVSQIGNQIIQLETRMDKRFTELEAHLDKRIDGLRSEMNQITVLRASAFPRDSSETTTTQKGLV